VIELDFSYYGSVSSDLSLVKTFIDKVLNELNYIIDNENAIFDVRLIMNELIINGVFHGNQCMDEKCVKLNLTVKNKKITIRVEDEGEGFDLDLNEYDPNDLTCGGRGLVLVDGLSDELIVNNNSITAIKYLQ